MASKKTDKITVEAELSVTSPEGSELVRRFDRAWTLACTKPVPVLIHFVRFARVDE